MPEPFTRLRPSSPAAGQRSINQGNTKRLWVRLDINYDDSGWQNASEDWLFNQATYVDVEVRDVVDDVKTKLLEKLSYTRWVRFKDNTNILLGFYYHSSQPLAGNNTISERSVDGSSSVVGVLSYSEYQNLMQRDKIRSGRWSQLHKSLNRPFNNGMTHNAALDAGAHDVNGRKILSDKSEQREEQADQQQKEPQSYKYTYKVIIEPDMSVMTVYRELYGGFQKSEYALTVFYSSISMTKNSPTPEVLSPSELLDPLHVLMEESTPKEQSLLFSNLSQGSVTNIPGAVQGYEKPRIMGSFSGESNGSGILLLPKGVSADEIEIDADSHSVHMSTPSIKDQGVVDAGKFTLETETPLTEEEVGLSLVRSISPSELVRPLSRRGTPSLEKQGELSKRKVFPRINVLIVEDNAINQAILALFLRKNGISYKVAKDGQEAVDKWKEGDSHLILMDLQLPKLSGLEATKQIRELERLNHIGTFSERKCTKRDVSHKNGESRTESELLSDKPNNCEDPGNEKCKLLGEIKLDKSKFRSPVIIVALTASYAQSDRTEALLAGCNDYLTKPVNLDWLSKKLTEWGCMQALIDFDGWTEGQRRMTENVVLRPQISATRKSQTTSTRSVPRVSSLPSSVDSNDHKLG